MTNDAICVRALAPDDIAACVAIVVDWIRNTDWMRVKDGPEVIEAHFRRAISAGRTVLVADKGGKILGYLSMDDRDYVHGIYVDAATRGMGVGQRLIAAAKQRAHNGLELGVFESNHDARRFYEREGFRPVSGGIGFDPDLKLPVQKMRWWGSAP